MSLAKLPADLPLPNAMIKCKTPVPGSRSLAGQSLLEFAITLPVLLMVLVGVLDLGRLFFSYIAVINAARAGARYGAERPYDVNGIIAIAQTEPQTQVTVTTATSPACTWNPVTGKYDIGKPSGSPITVTVQANFQLITTYIFGGGTIPLQASNTWLVYHDCGN